MSAKVLVGAFSIEGDSFVPGTTSLADFQSQVWCVGDAVTRDCAGPTNELAGAWDALEAAGFELVGGIAATSSPGPPAAAGVFDIVLESLLERCTPDVAGVYLMLHGSALVEGIDDPEGVILSAIRERLGPTTPIAASFDLHAYVTHRMVQALDIVTAYRTCPHVDLYERGRQAGALLAGSIAGEISPVCRQVRLPMITPPELHDSTRDPFRGLQARCDEAEQKGALAAAMFCTQPWLDVPELGWSAVVTTDNDPALAHTLASAIAEEAWQVRGEFMATSGVPMAEALRQARQTPGPFVVADLGDATNGGSVGDSTELLRALLAHPVGRAALTVCDPAAVSVARAAGPGATIELALGSGAPGEYNERTTVRGQVRSLWQGTIVYTHPAARGIRDSPGASAIVDVGEVTLIVHSRPVRVIDPAVYVDLGIDIASMQLLQAKSHVSYRAGFDPVTTGSVLANTKGPTTADLATLPFRKRPVPLFPFEDADWSSS